MTGRGQPSISTSQLRDALGREPDRQRVAEDLATIARSVELTPQRRARRMETARVVLVLVALALLTALATALAIGTRPRLPPMTGLARPGLIAFDQGGDIYVANQDGTGRMQLTSGPATDSHPTWSPDGRSIAYLSRSPDLTWAIIVMGADGRAPVVVADGLFTVGDPAWSPDSRRIAFGSQKIGPETAVNENYDWRMYVVEVDRPIPVRLGGPDVFGQDPRWSPDGSKIAFKRTFPCCGAKTNPELWVMAADGSDPHQVSQAVEVYCNLGSGNRLLNTVWSPDGARLAFLADGIDGNADVYVVDADGTHERNLSNDPDEEYWPSWSPDGTRIAFVSSPVAEYQCGRRDHRDPGNLVVVDPDGAHRVRFFDVLAGSYAPTWAPDGSRLLGYVHDSRLGTDALAVFDPASREPPTTFPIPDFSAATWQRVAP